MAGKTHQPLSTRDAKAQLREVASHTGAVHWIRAHPYEAVGLGVATGMVLGSRRRSPLAFVALVRRLTQILL